MHVSSFLADILFLFKKIYIGKPANGVTDLKLSFFFFFSLFLFFSFDDWCEEVMHLVDALHLHAFHYLPHGHTELFCFDIKAYLWYPLSHNKSSQVNSTNYSTNHGFK